MLNIAKEFLSMQKEVKWSPKSPAIREAHPHTANASPQGSVFSTFVKEKKKASIFFKHFLFCSLSEQIIFLTPTSWPDIFQFL